MYAYTEDWSRVVTYIPYMGNNEVEPFIVHLDLLMAYDIFFFPYSGHREMYLFDVISLYFRWITRGLSLMYPYMPKRVMHLFGYL